MFQVQPLVHVVSFWFFSFNNLNYASHMSSTIIGYFPKGLNFNQLFLKLDR